MIWLRTPTAAALLLLASLTLAGCTHSRVVQQEEPAPEDASTLVVGEFIADDADHAREVRRFRRTLIARLRQSGAFDRVLAAPAPVPPEAMILTGHVHRIGDGSEALRFIVGIAGAPRLRVRFAIEDAAGVRLAAFAEEVHGADGTGYAAHWNPIYLDDIVDDLADRAATDIARWRQRKPLDPGLLDAAFDDWLDFGGLDPTRWQVFKAATWDFLP